MEPLATPTQLGAFMQETIATTDASALLYLSIASGMVRDALQQQISAVADEVILVDPLDGAYVLLPELPIGAVTLVETFDGTAWVTADPATYTVSKRLGMIAAKPGYGASWPSAPESWRVTYSHGFNTVPDAIVGVVLGVAARAYASPVAVDSERIGGYQVKYLIESAGFSPLEQLSLSRYKVARIA
jgi:hypothetical protein